MARTTSDWVVDGETAVRFHEQQGYLVKETYQPGRNAILEQNAEIRKSDVIQRPPTGSTGWYIGEIPNADIPYVRSKYPELFHGDRELRKRALIKFSNDPEMAPYVFRRA